MNVNRGRITVRDMSAEFPVFTATLAPGSRVKATLRGTETFGMSNEPKTTAIWDVRVDATLYAK